MKKQPPFFIVVIDSDQGLINVLGPMTDDTSLNKRVEQAQNAGRKVHCSTATYEDHLDVAHQKKTIAERWQREHGDKFTQTDLLP